MAGARKDVRKADDVGTIRHTKSAGKTTAVLQTMHSQFSA